MPRVRVTRRAIVRVRPGLNVVYAPVESILAPDAHIEAIVAQGAGERLSRRGDARDGGTEAPSQECSA